jgi:hypothetical protein
MYYATTHTHQSHSDNLWTTLECSAYIPIVRREYRTFEYIQVRKCIYL